MSNSNHHIDPPKWPQKLLTWFCDDALLEAIEGDLWEAFQADAGQYSARKARLRYFINTVKFLKPQFMQQTKGSLGMVSKANNYLKISFRNFQRHKLVSAINLVGLSLGLAVTLISWLYLQHHLTADAYMADSDRIYRVVRDYRSQTYTNLHFPNYYGTSRQGQLLNINAFADLPQVDQAAQFTISNSDIMGRGFYVEANNKKLRGGPILYTNTPEQLQSIFQWEMIQGSFESSTSEGVIISDKVASRYFPDSEESIVGEELFIDDKAFLIKGVVEHIPENAHFDFNLIAMVDSIPYTWGAYTYVKLAEGQKDLFETEKRMFDITKRHTPGADEDDLEKGVTLQPLRDIHLGSDYLYELESNLNPVYLYLFMAIGIVVLTITITNYVNLTIAINANRLKEVGIRKAIGANKRDVFVQFIFESLLTVIISLCIGLGLVYLALPYFNQSLEVVLSWSELVSLKQLSFVIGATLLVGVISGWYPSYILAKKPFEQLISKGGTQKRKFNVRSILLGFQVFTVITLAGFAFYVNQQINFVTQSDLGFEKEGILTVNFRGLEKYRVFKERLESNPSILRVGSGGTPANTRYNTTTYKFEEIDDVFDDANQVDMDYATAQMLGLKSSAFDLLENGKKDIMLLNETAAKKYEVVSGKSRANLLEQLLIMEPEVIEEDGTVGYPSEINGFVQDFHYFSKREAFNPLFIRVHKEIPWIYGVNIKLQTDSLFETMSFIENAYAEVETETPFIAKFIDDKLEYLYSEEYRISGIVKALGLLSILLAFAGLIGLAYYSAKLMQKEVAIRKVLGAKILGLLGVMAKEFLVIGLIASLLAVPVAVLVINSWLTNFAFRVDLNILVLVAIAALGILILYLGVIGQSYKTTRINPIEPLRSEA